MNILLFLTFILLKQSAADTLLRSKNAGCDVSLFGCQLEVSTLFAAISAIATAISLFFIYLYTNATVESTENEKDARRAEIKHRYYDEIVSGRVLPMLKEFRNEVRKIVSYHQKEINKLHKNNATSREMHEQVQKLTNEFQNLRAKMLNRVTESLDAWGNENLRRRIRDIIFNMEDKVAKKFPELMHRHSKDPDIMGVVSSKTGEVEREVRDNDPFMVEISK